MAHVRPLPIEHLFSPVAEIEKPSERTLALLLVEVRLHVVRVVDRRGVSSDARSDVTGDSGLGEGGCDRAAKHLRRHMADPRRLRALADHPPDVVPVERPTGAGLSARTHHWKDTADTGHSRIESRTKSTDANLTSTPRREQLAHSQMRECHPMSPPFTAHAVIRYVECHWAHAPDRRANRLRLGHEVPRLGVSALNTVLRVSRRTTGERPDARGACSMRRC